jgi:hypothetical protein
MDEIYKNKAIFNGFSQDIQNIIKSISFNNMNGLNLFGSMAIRSQQYASDYDLFQFVKVEEVDETKALKKLAMDFKFIIHELIHTKDVYIGDIKAGSIEEWKIFNDKIFIEGDKVVNFNYLEAHTKLQNLKNNNVISLDEYNTSNKFLVKNPSPFEYLLMEKNIKFNVLRWKPKDIINGYITLRNFKVVTLEEAFCTPAITKLDLVVYLQSNQYTEMSIIYQFINNNHVLNKFDSNSEYNIKTDILYYLQTKFYFKACKRIFTLLRMKGNNNDCIKINSVLNDSQVGILYLIYSDIGTMLYILENTQELPIKRIEYEVDQFKNKLSNIYKIPEYLKQEPEIFNIIDHIKTCKKRKDIIDSLYKLSDILFHALNSYTLKLMKFKDIFPISRRFLP